MFLKSRARLEGPTTQQVDVAPIVEVGRRDGDASHLAIEQARLAGDVGERAVAVVAKQLRRRAQPAMKMSRSPSWSTSTNAAETAALGGRTDACRIGHVLEDAARSDAAGERHRPQEKQIGLAVVVVVAGDRWRSPQMPRPPQRPTRSVRIGEPSWSFR